MRCLAIRLISSLSEQPSSIQINEAQLAGVLGRFIKKKSRMLLTKETGDRMGQKSVCATEK